MVRELSRSPLVEIGAHTWASHYGLPANPQGSREPAAANRGWDKTTGRYESDAQFTRRMTDDVQKVTAKIHEVAGKTPRAWVWPYGAASGSTLTIAKQQGYQLAFTLNDGLGNVKDLDNIPRLLIAGNPSLKAFASAVTQIQEADPVRVMHVDLDYVYDPNPVQQAKNIDKLVQRVYDMKISHVFLQAFSDPQGDGTVKSLYFPNRWLPMRADLFNFVSAVADPRQCEGLCLDAGAGLRSCLRSAARSALGSANREGVTCPPAVRPSVATGSPGSPADHRHLRRSGPTRQLQRDSVSRRRRVDRF